MNRMCILAIALFSLSASGQTGTATLEITVTSHMPNYDPPPDQCYYHDDLDGGWWEYQKMAFLDEHECRKEKRMIEANPRKYCASVGDVFPIPICENLPAEPNPEWRWI